MKLFSTSYLLVLASTALFSVAGIAQAQYGGSASSQGNSQSASGGTAKPAGASDGMQTGYVDQRKRDERAEDGASPSKDAHVPDFPVDKKGKPEKGPKYEQGGAIGPN